MIFCLLGVDIDILLTMGADLNFPDESWLVSIFPQIHTK